jgi:hypothetical protein
MAGDGDEFFRVKPDAVEGSGDFSFRGRKPEQGASRPPVGLAQTPLRYDQQQPGSMTISSQGA